ncbi:MAG: HD domain-containing protein, partial [Patescibacteria group bacterium]
AFHDLAEVLVGDVPDFTTADLAGTHFRTAEEKSIQEQWANQRVLEALPDGLRLEAERALRILADISNEQTRFFHMLDKIEPIISVWRYISHHRETLDINAFLEAMSDFFTNPKVIGTCVNEEIRGLITHLQSKEAAQKFFINDQASDRLHALLAQPMIMIQN